MTSLSSVPVEYRPLHTYLSERFADVVVLKLAEIEDLLGFTLPHPARLQREWWTAPDADAEPSAQSRAWTAAHRTASPNLQAETVRFERVS
jgi:hypothetical protein